MTNDTMKTAANNLHLLVFALALISGRAIAAQEPTVPVRSPSAAGVASVRLAIISEEPSAVSAADLLTAELSSKPGVQLFERNEIDKVY